MAVVLAKTKQSISAPVSAPVVEVKSTKKLSLQDQLKELADSFGTISAEIATLKGDPKIVELLTKQSKLDETKKSIQELADKAFKAEEAKEVAGKKYVVALSAKSNSSALKEDGGKEAIFTLLGEENFVKLCSFGITDLRKYLTEEQLKDVLITERTGARTVKLK